MDEITFKNAPKTYAQLLVLEGIDPQFLLDALLNSMTPQQIKSALERHRLDPTSFEYDLSVY